MTGCRLLRSTGLSCKCFSIAVRCGLWIWNLLKVLHTVIHWGCNHPPFGEHGPASGGGAESGARRWRAGQTVALKQVRVGDLVLPSYAEYASEAAEMETIQSLLLVNVCCPSFTGVEDCALKTQALYTCILLFTLLISCSRERFELMVGPRY